MSLDVMQFYKFHYNIVDNPIEPELISVTDVDMKITYRDREKYRSRDRGRDWVRGNDMDRKKDKCRDRDRDMKKQRVFKRQGKNRC